MRSFYTKWEEIIKNCKFERNLSNCNVKKMQKDMENKQIKAIFESFGFEVVAKYNNLFQDVKLVKNIIFILKFIYLNIIIQ